MLGCVGDSVTPTVVPDAGTDAAADAPISCVAPKSICANACVDTTTDPDNCGGCGNKCGACYQGNCAKRVFVTHRTYTGAEIGGLGNADTACKNAANANALPGDYRAWLSTADPGTAVQSRFSTKFNGFYVLAKDPKTKVADSWGAGVPFDAKHSIDVDETGAKVSPGFVHTNTNAFGQPVTDVNDNSCSNFTSTTGNTHMGRTDNVATWTEYASQACSTPGYLYCFEQ